MLPAAWMDRLPEFFTDLSAEALPEAGHFVHLEWSDLAASEMAALFDGVVAR